jgi:outer membrane murein-binding lipoprotein Lpp
MNSMLDDRLVEGQIASLDEQLSNLAREVGVSSSAAPTSIKRLPITLATLQADWHYVAFVGSLLAASLGVVAWWWSSSADTAKMPPSDPAPLTRAAPEAVVPTAVALRSELSQQFQPMARDLAALSQTVEQLKARQEQLIRDNENLASQLKASREESARNNGIIDQIKADHIQMARESQTLIERLNASQDQLSRVIASASEPTATPEASPTTSPEEPKTMPEASPTVSSEEPKVVPDIPLPRPRQSANVVQTQRPARTPERPQAKKPQPSFSWPWSTR